MEATSVSLAVLLVSDFRFGLVFKSVLAICLRAFVVEFLLIALLLIALLRLLVVGWYDVDWCGGWLFVVV